MPWRPLNHAFAVTLALAALAVLSLASIRPGAAQETESEVSPVLNISPSLEPAPEAAGAPAQIWVRSLDGSGNNLDDPDMGAAFTPLRRRIESDYADGIEALAGAERPGPRHISNAVSAQDRDMANPADATDYFWQWGQFLDHDIDLTDGTHPPEREPIPVPTGDPYFDPEGTGKEEIPFNRSIYDEESGSDPATPRQQINQISGWIDASNVYGSDAVRAAALRTNDDSGRLKTSEGDLLPFNTDKLPNAGGSDSSLFLAGDVRANEQVALTALHTLFMREHNRLARLIAEDRPELSGDEIYQEARRIVGALMQAITYNEFLPVLLGPHGLAPYEGYDPSVDARIANVFSTAAYRFGHSALGRRLLRLDADGEEIADGHLPLRDAFFAPSRITDEGGIEPLLRGLAWQRCQAVDPFIVDDVRNFLFGEPGAGGFDLAALNIQRGRDHGLPGYNATRAAYGLEPAASFADISPDPQIQARLAAVYLYVDDVDLWTGGLAEERLHKVQVGETFATIIAEQFEALRDGDRFWYQLILGRHELREIENTRLADIIRRNTDIGDEIPDDVFHLSPSAGGRGKGGKK